MIIFTFETATIEPIDRRLFLSLQFRPRSFLSFPPPPRQWILIIRSVYKAEHSPINQRVTTRLIVRVPLSLLFIRRIVRYRYTAVVQRRLIRCRGVHRGVRNYLIAAVSLFFPLSLCLSLSLSSFRLSRVLQAGQYFRRFANVCEWVQYDYIDLHHHRFLLRFYFWIFVRRVRKFFLDRYLIFLKNIR